MKRICLFAGYDKNGCIDDYVIYYIQKLSEIADVYYYGDFDAKEKELLKLKKITKLAFAKRHGRYDYGSWDELIKKIGWTNIQKYDQLILANDSCFGPLYPLSEIFEIMEDKKCDFWGLSCGKGYHIHLQSYFLVFRKNILQSDCIKEFLQNVKKQASLKDVCELYEDQFTYYLRKNGFTYSSYIPYGEFKLHPYYETWNCIREKRFPLLKVKVFNGEVGYDTVKSWKKFISKNTDYDVNLIINNLHNRGYNDKNIDLAVHHWKKFNFFKEILSYIKTIPHKFVGFFINPIWRKYIYRFDRRFYENRYAIETKINELEEQIADLKFPSIYYPNVINDEKDKDSIISFLEKYNIIVPNNLKLIENKTVLNSSNKNAKLLSDEMAINVNHLGFFINSLKSILMYKKLEKLNILLCGNINEQVLMNFMLKGTNITILNNNQIKDNTLEKQILERNVFKVNLLSDYAFYNNQKLAIFDIILINRLEKNIKSGELLCILYNMSKNMTNETILILSIPHVAKIMNEFDKILEEVDMYWNHEYQNILESSFYNMQNSNCLVIMKKN